MSPPPSASAAADALCCTTEDQRSMDSEPETPRPTASNARQQVEDPTSPRPKIQTSQIQQPRSHLSHLAGSHENNDSSCLDPLIHADGADAIAEIFANAEVSTELESVPPNNATDPPTAEPSPAERTSKKQKRVAAKATSMLFLRHHMRSAEPDDSDELASRRNDRTEDAISGDETMRTGRSKERGKAWGKVKRLTRDLSRSSMNLLMHKKAGDETDKEENDKPKKKRAKLKKECSSSGSGSGPGLSAAPGANGAGTELHVLVETSVEVLVHPNAEAGDTGHQPSHDCRESNKEERVYSPTALDYHYDSDATSLPEIRDSVVERLTRAITQEGTQEKKESLVKKERPSVEDKALVGESGKTPGESNFKINPFELALPRSLTFSDLRDRLSGVRLSFSDDSRPSDPSTGSTASSGGVASDAAFLKVMQTHMVNEYVAPAMQQGASAEIENDSNDPEKRSSSDIASPCCDQFRKAIDQKLADLSAASRFDSIASPKNNSFSGQRHVGSNPYKVNPVQPFPSHGRTQNSLLQPPKENQRDSDAASVHLHLMHISRHLRSDSSMSSTTDLHRSVKDGGERAGPPSDRHSAVNKYVSEGQNGKRERETNSYPFRRLAHHNASSASNLQAQKPPTAMDDSQQQQSLANDSSSAQGHVEVGLGTPMFPDLRDVAQLLPPPVPPSRVRGERRTSTSSSTNASALTGFNSSRVPPAWGHVLSNVPTHANSTAMHSRQASGGNASRYAGSSVYSSRYGGATGSGVGFGLGAHSGLGTSGKAYEPSSVYSTRANSPSLSGSLSGAGTGSGTPQPSVFSGVAGSATGTGSQSGSGMKKSGYEIFEMPQDVDESEEEAKDEQTAVEGINGGDSGMPGAYPPTPGPFDGIEAEVKESDPPDDILGVDDKGQKQEGRCESLSENSVYETPDTTAVDLQDPPPETAPSPTAIMIQCPQSPPTGERTPLQPKSVKKNRSAMNLLGLQNALKPSLEHHDSRRKSVGAKLSGLNIFRSKTMSNLRRAASIARAGTQETKEDLEKTPLAQCEDKFDDSEATNTKDLALDGPTDRRGSAGTQALRYGVERHDRGQEYDDYDDDDDERRHHHRHHHHHRHGSGPRDSDPVEDRKPGRLSRALAIRDSLSPTSGSASQAAMWEKALKAHREEKSALFLSPEKGGKAKAQSLFRERSGSGSALRANAIDEKQDGQKRPRSAEPNSDAWSGFGGFGERGESSQAGARFRRSETVLLDPLDTGRRKSKVSLQAPPSGTKDKSGFLGDDLKTGHVPESASISPCTSPTPTPDDEPPLDLAGTWDEAEVDMNLGDLGAWSRYPSHTRELRNNSAGHADEVHARDFAYEIRLSEIAESEDGGGETATGNKPSRSPTGYKRVSTLGSASFKRRGKNKSRSSLPKSKSMTFGRSFLKHYIGLFRSQSEEFRRHGHGHRSSIAEGGILEQPELEILPPVWSSAPIVLEPAPRESAEVEAGMATKGGDGAGDEREQDVEKQVVEGHVGSQDENNGKQSLQEARAIGDGEKENAAQDSSRDESENKLDTKLEFEVPETLHKLSRSERMTGSSDASWKADARLWSKLCNSDSMSPLGLSEESLLEQRAYPYDRKAERSSEWQRNVRFWTRLADRSQEFNAAVQHDASVSHLLDANLDPNDAVDLMNDVQDPSEYANRSPSPLPRTSEEWRNDARLFSQMYESCVGLPQFGSTEDINANGRANKIGEQRRHQQSKDNSASSLRASSAGVIDGLVTGRENAHPAGAARWRTLSGGDAGAYSGAHGGHLKNESAISMASLRRSTWDMMKVLD